MKSTELVETQFSDKKLTGEIIMARTRAQAKVQTKGHAKAKAQPSKERAQQNAADKKLIAIAEKIEKTNKQLVKNFEKIVEEHKKIEEQNKKMDQILQNIQSRSNEQRNNQARESVEVVPEPTERPARVLTEELESHHHRSNFLPPIYMILIACSVAGSFFIFGIDLPAIILGFVVTLIASKALEIIYDSDACDAAKMYQEKEDGTLMPAELNSFNAGVNAARTYTGMFNAWGIKDTYSEYKAFIAGKHLAENDNDVEITRISRNRM